EQHLIEVDDVSDLGIQALDAQLVAGAHAVLFTACTKNRIHWEKLLGIRSGAGPQEATHFSECSEGGQRDRPRGRGARSRSRPPPKGPAAPCRSVRSPALSPALAKAAHLRHHLLNACCLEPTFGAVARRTEILGRRRLGRRKPRHLPSARQRRRARQSGRSPHYP